jgi:nucleotidyltransferase/DNA polymerase involved in DNA repair
VIQGEENTEVRQQEMPKSLSVERTFKRDVSDFQEVKREAEDAASELIRRVKSSGLAFRVTGVKIRFRGFETHTREKTLLSHTDSEAALFETVDFLLEEFKREERPVRLVGVRVADLIRATAESRRLDEWSGRS